MASYLEERQVEVRISAASHLPARKQRLRLFVNMLCTDIRRIAYNDVKSAVFSHFRHCSKVKIKRIALANVEILVCQSFAVLQSSQRKENLAPLHTQPAYIHSIKMLRGFAVRLSAMGVQVVSKREQERTAAARDVDGKTILQGLFLCGYSSLQNVVANVLRCVNRAVLRLFSLWDGQFEHIDYILNRLNANSRHIIATVIGKQAALDSKRIVSEER